MTTTDETTTAKPTEAPPAKQEPPKKVEKPVETQKPDEKGDQKPEESKKAENGEKSEKPKRNNKNRRVNQMRKEGQQENQGGGDQPRRKRLDTWNARDLKIIRGLSGILKHGMFGFVTDEQGYLFLEDILQHHHFKEVLGVKLDDLKRICNDKRGNRQFELGTEEKDGKNLLKVKIKAKEEGKQTDEEITPKKSEEYTVCIHGTYWKAWEDMKQKGITRFYPNHIHFASGMLGKDGILSGKMQQNCEVLVYIDLKRAVVEGIKFFRGSDGVLWTDGNEKGVLPPKYFNYAVHVSPVTGQQIYLEDLSELHGEGEAMEQSNRKKNTRPGSAMSESNRGGGRGGYRGRGGRGGRGGNRGNRRPNSSKTSNNNAPNNAEKAENVEDGGVDAEGFQKPRSKRRNNRNKGPKPQPTQQNNETAANKTGGDVEKVTEKMAQATVTEQ